MVALDELFRYGCITKSQSAKVDVYLIDVTSGDGMEQFMLVGNDELKHLSGDRLNIDGDVIGEIVRTPEMGARMGLRWRGKHLGEFEVDSEELKTLLNPPEAEKDWHDQLREKSGPRKIWVIRTNDGEGVWREGDRRITWLVGSKPDMATQYEMMASPEIGDTWNGESYAVNIDESFFRLLLQHAQMNPADVPAVHEWLEGAA